MFSSNSMALLGPECLLPCETKSLDVKYHSEVPDVRGFSSDTVTTWVVPPAYNKNPEEAKSTELQIQL